MSGSALVHAWVHVRRPSGVRGDRDGEHRGDGARGGARQRPRPTKGRSVRCSSRCATSRSSATSVAPATSTPIELVRDQETKETFTEEESETLLRGFLSGELYRRGPDLPRRRPRRPRDPAVAAADRGTGAVRGDRGGVAPGADRGRRSGCGCMLTVRELLRGLEVRVLAGEAGLDLPVRWVHISELPDPTPWLSGGELLLTTGMQLEDPEAQRAFVARLCDHQLAGLGFGTGFAHPDVPEALLEAAAEREFPVFEVPYELPFIAITEAAFTQLVNEQYAVLRRAITAHERLERIVLSERGLDALARLAGFTGGRFGARVRRSRRAARLALVPPVARSGRGGRAAERGERPGAPARSARVSPSAWRRTATVGWRLPVAADGAAAPSGSAAARMPEAWLVALKDSGPLTDFDRLTLHQAVTIVALELFRARVAGDTERRLAGNLLADVLSGELAGAELARRLAPLGLADRVAAIVVERPNARLGRARGGCLGRRAAGREPGCARRVERVADLRAARGAARRGTVRSRRAARPAGGGGTKRVAAARRGAGRSRRRGQALVPRGAVRRGGARLRVERKRLERRLRFGLGCRFASGGAGRDLSRPRLVPAAPLAPG